MKTIVLISIQQRGINILSDTSDNRGIPGHLILNPIHFLSTGFGAGLSPVAPGTVGTLVAVPLYYFISDLSWQIYLLIVLVGFFTGIYLCQQTADALGVHDHGGIVWDEIIGYWITMSLVPDASWLWMLAGFITFRFFDILKPWPIKQADARLKGGFGIMFDDVLAAVYAMAVLQVFVLMTR